MRDSSNFDDPKGINEKRGGFFDDKVSPVGNPQSCLCGKSNSAVSGNVISIVCSYVYLYKVLQTIFNIFKFDINLFPTLESSTLFFDTISTFAIDKFNVQQNIRDNSP